MPLFDANNNILSKKILNGEDNSDVLSSVLADSNDNGDTDNIEGGYYYKITGIFLDKIGNSQNVYLADNIILQEKKNEKGVILKDTNGKPILIKKIINPKALNIKYNLFVEKAGTIYTEGSYQYGFKNINQLVLEAFAIAESHVQHPEITAFGKNKPSTKQFMITEPKKRNQNIDYIYISAVIHGILKDTNAGENSTHWDGADVLCGMARYNWEAEKHQKQKAEGKFKGISDPENLADTFYNTWKTHLEDYIANGKNPNVKADYQAKLDHLEPLGIYEVELDENGKAKYLPLYEIRATYALSLFYKKLNL